MADTTFCMEDISPPRCSLFSGLHLTSSWKTLSLLATDPVSKVEGPFKSTKALLVWRHRGKAGKVVSSRTMHVHMLFPATAPWQCLLHTNASSCLSLHRNLLFYVFSRSHLLESRPIGSFHTDVTVLASYLFIYLFIYFCQAEIPQINGVTGRSQPGPGDCSVLAKLGISVSGRRKER